MSTLTVTICLIAFKKKKKKKDKMVPVCVACCILLSAVFVADCALVNDHQALFNIQLATEMLVDRILFFPRCYREYWPG